MIGPEGCADHTVAWLAERIPARLRVLETRYQLAAGTLPDPVLVAAQERGQLAIEDWPSVFVLPQRTRSQRLTEVRPDGSEVYRVRYMLRILSWVRSDGYATTDQLRKRYVLAVREALLERKQLAPAPTYGDGDFGTQVSDVVVVPESMREDYSDVMTDEAGRTIAAAFIDVDVDVEEVLDGPAALGTVETTEVDTAALPPHPAL